MIKQVKSKLLHVDDDIINLCVDPQNFKQNIAEKKINYYLYVGWIQAADLPASGQREDLSDDLDR